MDRGTEGELEFSQMAEGDIEGVISLWMSCDGVECNSHDDNPESLKRFLDRNGEFCIVVKAATAIVGSVLCSYDGRKAYIYHMAVADTHRRMGIARKMMDLVFGRLRTYSVRASHLFVLNDNIAAKEFWQRCGYKVPENYAVMTAML